MDEMSETESQGRNSKVDEDGSTIPAVITDEYFDEIASKCRAVSYEIDFAWVFNCINYRRILKCKLNICRRCEAY